MIELSFLMLLSRMIQTNAAGLRATNKNNTRREDEKQLRLTDDDTIQFYKVEIEMGYLNRDSWEKLFVASSLVEDDDDENADDDQYRDPNTGGFLNGSSTNTDSATGNFIGASRITVNYPTLTV